VQELLARLVAFDTTSAKSNLELIAFVKTYLDGYGVASTLIPSADGAKASLFASIGPSSGGIGLSSHSDCVPVEGHWRPSVDRPARIRPAAPPRHHRWRVHRHGSDRRA
jgi:acetylornithine deacetylase/succinyl-diaminopimelate desuccinylase-like protein